MTSFAPSLHIKKDNNSDLDESQKLSNRVHEPQKSAFPRKFLMPDYINFRSTSNPCFQVQLTPTAALTSHQALSTDKTEDEVLITHIVINERTSC